MKKKLIAIMLALSVFVGVGTAQAIVHWDDLTGVGGSAPQAKYDPAANYVTCSAGWKLKSYTFDFGPFDSTGSTTMRFWYTATNSVTKTYSQVEHDGVTRTWYTGYAKLYKATWSYYYLWSGGAAYVSVVC